MLLYTRGVKDLPTPHLFFTESLLSLPLSLSLVRGTNHYHTSIFFFDLPFHSLVTKSLIRGTNLLDTKAGSGRFGAGKWSLGKPSKALTGTNMAGVNQYPSCAP